MVLPARLRAANKVPDPASRFRIEFGRGFIKEQDIGIADHAQRNFEPPLLPARERRHPSTGQPF